MPAPRLLTAKLMWRNRKAQARVGGAMALLLCGVLGALFFVERGPIAGALDPLRRHGLSCLGLAACATAVLVARRRSLERARFVRSWLAAVPIRSCTARWEAFLVETSPASAALAVIASLALVALPVLVRRADILAVWADLSGGVMLGVILSYLVPPPKPVDLPPGSRYVPHRNVKRTLPVRPSLAALGRWPIRQLFAWAQPKAVARATIPILVMMPLGTTADTAMVAIGLFGVVGALVLLCFAVISVGRLAMRWLAPLPVRAGGAVFRAFLLPACAFAVGASAIGAFLLVVLVGTR
ncbi:MAG TPA: hypothetical protein VHU43_04535 [Steroidobacteraceae bacterium]|jgi:hypothetical protein|nr:hypothetical protein [Steroidobacteraceae bacterium]